MASVKFKLSPQLCPKCNYSFKLLGVRLFQEVTCFKCGKIFTAHIKEETPGNEPKRRTAIFALLMITFVLFCIERAVTTSTEATTTPLEPVIFVSETILTPVEPMTTVAETATTSEEPVVSAAETIATPVEPMTTVAETTTTPEEPVITAAETIATPVEPLTTVAETATTPEEPIVSAAEPIATPVEPITTVAETVTTSEEPAPIDFLLTQADSNFKAREYSEAISNYEAYMKKTSPLTAEAKLEIYWKLAQSEEKTGNKETAIIWNEIILKEFENIRDWKIHSARSALKRLAASQI